MGSQAGPVNISCNSGDLTQGFTSILSMQLKRRRISETLYTLLATISALPNGGNPARVAYIKEGSPFDNRDGVSPDGVLRTDNLEPSYLTVEIAQVNLLCTDEAEYLCNTIYCSFDGSIQTRITSANMTVFVPPSDITLSVTKNGLTLDGGIQGRPSELNVGDIITLACFGKIGSNPSIEYTWLRSSYTGSDNIPYTPLKPSDENKGEVPSAPTDCMYSRTATLLYNISLEDANRNAEMGFRCQARYSVSTLGAQEVTSSTFFIKALVKGITIDPSVPVMGSQAGPVSISCNSEDLTQGFTSILSMQLRRRRNFETQYTLLAIISAVPEGGNPARVAYIKEGSPLDNRDGVSPDGVLKTDNLETSYLTVEIAQVNLLCTDEAEYQCSTVYYSLDGNIQTQSTSANMTIFVAPSDITLSVTKDGPALEGSKPGRPLELNVGDILTLTCSGSIGSNPSIEYTWLRSSYIGPDYIPYTPLQPSNENKGELPSAPTDCMYSRTATLLYNISLEDANRNAEMGFRCQAKYTLASMGEQTVTSSAFLFKALGRTVPNQTEDIYSAGNEDAGMIVRIVIGVAVLLASIVLVGFIVMYRKQKKPRATDTEGENLESRNPHFPDGNIYAKIDENESADLRKTQAGGVGNTLDRDMEEPQKSQIENVHETSGTCTSAVNRDNERPTDDTYQDLQRDVDENQYYQSLDVSEPPGYSSYRKSGTCDLRQHTESQ